MSTPCYYCELEDNACRSCIHSNEYVDPTEHIKQLEAHIAVLREALEAVKSQRIDGYLFPAAFFPGAWNTLVVSALSSTPETNLREIQARTLEWVMQNQSTLDFLQGVANAIRNGEVTVK